MEKAAYSELEEMQENHWWYSGRRAVVGAILEHGPIPKDARILDIGSGYGGMIDLLLPYGTVDALEPYEGCRDALLQRGAGRVFEIHDFPATVPANRYDLVTMFDVLEHIEDDAQALTVIGREILSPGGSLLLTVPAYQWLWSAHDEAHHHFRRYTIGRLTALLKESGFLIERRSYMMSYLFPLALGQRLVSRILPAGSSTAPPPAPLNRLFARVFAGEADWLRRRSFPWGLSVIALAKRR